MRKIIILLLALLLTSCDGIVSYLTPAHYYALTDLDKQAITLVFGSGFVQTIQDHIYTKDLPYGSGIGGMYSPEANEIWMNENAEIACYKVAHEATHYYQANVLNEDFGDSDQPRKVPKNLLNKLDAEQEANIVELYVYFSLAGDGPVSLDGGIYDSPIKEKLETYIKTFIVHN